MVASGLKMGDPAVPGGSVWGDLAVPGCSVWPGWCERRRLSLEKHSLPDVGERGVISTGSFP